MHSEHLRRRDDESGFTLIELLIAIVVVGILTAVAVVSITGLTNNGKVAACQASVDAAKAAGAVYYANNSTTPADLAALVPNQLTLANGVAVAGNVMSKGTDWSVTYLPGSNNFEVPSGQTQVCP